MRTVRAFARSHGFPSSYCFSISAPSTSRWPSSRVASLNTSMKPRGGCGLDPLDQDREIDDGTRSTVHARPSGSNTRESTTRAMAPPPGGLPNGFSKNDAMHDVIENPFYFAAFCLSRPDASLGAGSALPKCPTEGPEDSGT